LKLGDASYSYYHKLANGNEFGLSANVAKETVVSSCINHAVTLKPEFYGYK